MDLIALITFVLIIVGDKKKKLNLVIYSLCILSFTILLSTVFIFYPIKTSFCSEDEIIHFVSYGFFNWIFMISVGLFVIGQKKRRGYFG